MAGATWDLTQYSGPIGYSLTVPSTVAGQSITITGWTSNQQVQLYGTTNGIGLAQPPLGEITPGSYIRCDLTALSSSVLSTHTMAFKGTCPTGCGIWASILTNSSNGVLVIKLHSQAVSGVVNTLYSSNSYGLSGWVYLYLGPSVTTSSFGQGCTISLLQSTGDF